MVVKRFIWSQARKEQKLGEGPDTDDSKMQRMICYGSDTREARR
jgi:hypothetical protein